MDDSWIALFDRVASSYDEVVPFFAAFGELTAAELPSPAPGGATARRGAGAGAIALAARRRGYEVSAVDGSAAMVARLAESLPAARVADAADLPFDDASFDVVTAGFVLQLLDDSGAALAEMRRVLKPGGLLVATVFGHRRRASSPTTPAVCCSPSSPAPCHRMRAATGHRRSTHPRTWPRPASARCPRDICRWSCHWTSRRRCGAGTPHGTSRFFDALDEQHREEFHQRLVADLAARLAVVSAAPPSWSPPAPDQPEPAGKPSPAATASARPPVPASWGRRPSARER